MANLDDLDTTGIGIIAFWNALDHWTGPGAKEIDPTDCIGVFSDGDYDLYDNGIEGYKPLGSGRYFHARVKSDGWMVAWIDRTNTYGIDKGVADFGEDGYKGYYDILYNWATGSANISTTQTYLSYLISQLYNALSNKADFDYSDANVGHYCYEYPNANVLTLCSLQRTNVNNANSGWNESSKTAYIQYTSGTTIYYIATTGYSARGKGADWEVEVKIAEHSLLTTAADVPSAAVADAKANNWMPDALVEYPLYLRARTSATYGGGNYTYVHGAMLLIWA